MKTILWDFDGVILDSMSVRNFGFEEIFKDYNQGDVKALLNYHITNGGLSRYIKIRYFFNNILKQQITDQEVLTFASSFSSIMKKELVNKNNLILDTVNFIKKNHEKYNFHIVSGSDQEELRFLCNELNISKYFLTINGSPTHKNELVKQILKTYKYSFNNCCLIGDSINDFEAAKINNIAFFGFNSEILKQKKVSYISSFDGFNF